MDVFNVNSVLLNNSYDYSNITSNYYNYSNTTSNYYNYSNTTSNYYNYSNTTFRNIDNNFNTIIHVTTCIIIIIGLPLTLVAIYSLYSLVRKDHVAPIYVINLLISDLIQLCCMIDWVARAEYQMVSDIFYYIYYFGVIASISFMVCIALERYLVIAHPLWYHFRRNIKISVVVCVLIWTVPLVYLSTFHYWYYTEIISAIFFFLPLPLFIFFLGGTLKALSASRVPTDEKRRIVGILVLVLLIYTLLFLPSIIWYASYFKQLTHLSLTFLKLSPLADSFLYVFMRKGIIDKLLSSVCCCRMDSNDTNSPSV